MHGDEFKGSLGLELHLEVNIWRLLSWPTQPALHAARHEQAAYHMVYINALDVGSHLIDPVADKLARRQASVDLVQVSRVRLILQCPGEK